MKKKTHDLAVRAKEWRRRHHVRQSDMARLVGVSINAYRNFEGGISGSMQAPHMAAIEALITQDAPPGAAEAPAAYGVHRSFVHTLAAELRLLSDTLLSQDLPAEAKARRFEAGIKTYSDNLADYLEAIRSVG